MVCIAGMATSVTDVRDLMPALEAYGKTAASKRARYTREIVQAATSRRAAEPWCSAVRCIARVGRRACGERIGVGQPERGRVVWSCPACAEGGSVIGFVGTQLDMSPYAPASKKLRLWGFDDEGRDVLLDATTHTPALRAVVARGSPAQDVPDLLILQATVDELDDMYTLVEQLTDATRSFRRRDLLTGMRASLCTAIDGF